MLVESSLPGTTALTAHLLLARREAELLGDSLDADPTSEHLLRAAVWSGEVYGLGDQAAREILLVRLGRPLG